MAYVVSGLPLPPFQRWFGATEQALGAQGIRRVVADGPGYPCRVTLEDAAPGETLLLLPWVHHDTSSPFRASGPVFVRESATATRVAHGVIPEQQRSRLLSVRAYDAQGWMQAAEVVEGTQLEPLVARWFEDAGIATLHVHYARRGCYGCRIDRA